MKKTKIGRKVAEQQNIRVTLIRSLIGYPRNQRETARGLGLRKINSTVVRPNCPEIRGMVNKISHLVKVEEISK
jgi:large subunit ribosomal protein L30